MVTLQVSSFCITFICQYSSIFNILRETMRWSSLIIAVIELSSKPRNGEISFQFGHFAITSANLIRMPCGNGASAKENNVMSSKFFYYHFYCHVFIFLNVKVFCLPMYSQCIKMQHISLHSNEICFFYDILLKEIE